MFKKRSLAKAIGVVALLGAAGAQAVDPLTVSGNRVLSGGVAKSLAGNSLFWSNDLWGQEGFYSADTVAMLKNDFNASIVRAAMGVDAEGGYLESPASNKGRVEAVVDAAIANDIYVIIDWHSHVAENFPGDAVSFFQEMATKYGNSDNVIYEIYNEPLQVSWNGTIKPYAETVINAIRAIDPDNLIIVGTPSWSQGVVEASQNPINGTNIAYALHFYAGTHHQWLRNDAATAMNNGIALFVTEWGTVNANGDGAVNHNETDLWMDFLLANDISHLNWAVSNKVEGSSVFTPGGGLTESGTKVKQIVSTWPNQLTGSTSSTSSSSSSSTSSTGGGGVSCTGVSVYP
ncbi:MAG: glycoside hydrolase family 5 protein, partial [Gammaproteobacteria bacterium]|nr:glycoside hydrolase family 5 protein [Gammaproteobacteria bacterium]